MLVFVVAVIIIVVALAVYFIFIYKKKDEPFSVQQRNVGKYILQSIPTPWGQYTWDATDSPGSLFQVEEEGNGGMYSI